MGLGVGRIRPDGRRVGGVRVVDGGHAGAPVRLPLRPRARLAVVAVVGVAAVGILGLSGLDDSLVYYWTPSELSADAPPPEERIRLGGMVETGSVRHEGDTVTFVLTDGADDITVAHQGDPPGVFQEGQGALVEGAFAADGVFHSDLLVVRHSNEYRGSDGEVYEPGDREAGGQP
jgi:cytochrome c-type biogenesis protein CcmE